jgi:hypothetical protein
MACDTLFLKREVNFPSNNTATGIFAFLNLSLSGSLLFSLPLINAGVAIVLAFDDELNKIVFLIPSTSIVSIEFTNRPLTKPKFLLIM